ncbi:MAG: phosphatidylglycerol lysyltransferase domain-containing protein [Phycisphaerae bacterium]
MTMTDCNVHTISTGRELAVRLLGAFGCETVCFQTLQAGMNLWFSKNSLGMVGFVESGRHLITVGSPVADRDRIVEIAEEFEGFAHQRRRRVCYMCVENRNIKRLAAAGRGQLIIGAIPVWNPAHWTEMRSRNARLRYQIARAKRKCDEVTEITPSHAARSVAIGNLIGEWLAQRRLMPMRFLADPFILSDAGEHRRVFCLRGRNGPLAGLLAASPIPARRGMFIEQIVRAPHAPNGAVELMIDHAMQEFASRYRHVTLGLVAGSQFASDHENPWWARMARYSARRWGGELYRFGSLEQFRAALQPEIWEPVYAASDRSHITIRDILAACRAMFRFPFFRLSRGWQAAYPYSF